MQLVSHSASSKQQSILVKPETQTQAENAADSSTGRDSRNKFVLYKYEENLFISTKVLEV